MSNDQFAQLVLNAVSPDAKFQPTATYDPDGDCIEFIAAPDSFYAERVDSLVTVYRSQDNDAVVGSLIKGVSQFVRDVLQRVPGFRIEIHAGRIKLEHLFTAKLWSGSIVHDALPALVYQDLRKVAMAASVEVEVPGVAA
jgi:hypothetical protein